MISPISKNRPIRFSSTAVKPITKADRTTIPTPISSDIVLTAKAEPSGNIVRIAPMTVSPNNPPNPKEWVRSHCASGSSVAA